MKTLWIVVVFITCQQAHARELNWNEPRLYGEIAYDLGLYWGSGAASRLLKKDPGDGRDEFPTQYIDEKVRVWVHGGSTSEPQSQHETNSNLFADRDNRIISLLSLGNIMLRTPTGHKLGATMTLVHSIEGWFFFNTSFKNIIGRYRPRSHFAKNRDIKKNKMDSFPSGHAGEGFAWSTSAILLCDLDKKWTVGLYTLATASGVLRMMGDSHYLSDIAAGAALGIIVPYYTYKYFEDAKPVQTGDTRVDFSLNRVTFSYFF